MNSPPSISSGLQPLVWSTCGSHLESVHYGHFVRCSAEGDIIELIGDAMTMIFPRSAIKLVQCLPYASIQNRENLSYADEFLALACSSHRAEPAQISLLAYWARTIGVNPEELECPPATLPHLVRLHSDFSLSSEAVGKLANNNSGKHLAVLSTCRALNEPLAKYTSYSHPAQWRLRAAIELMTSFEMADFGDATERCGFPTSRVPLLGLAISMSKFFNDGTSADALISSASSVRTAIARHPFLLVGQNSLSSRTIVAGGGGVLIKGGSEGVYAGALAIDGSGFALKILDGRQRAADFAILSFLRKAAPQIFFGKLQSIYDRMQFPEGMVTKGTRLHSLFDADFG